jgi:hypothetical protein
LPNQLPPRRGESNFGWQQFKRFTGLLQRISDQQNEVRAKSFILSDQQFAEFLSNTQEGMMFDPKFNDIPVEDESGTESSTSGTTSRSAGTPRRGLSINDTIAGDTMLSVGGRGVNVSGVTSGAGAGAGTVAVTPGNRGESPAPNVVPGPSSTGVTPLGETQSAKHRGSSLDLDAPTYEEISGRAYQRWCDRGRPHGTAEEDWTWAEQDLIEERRSRKTSAAAGVGGD